MLPASEVDAVVINEGRQHAERMLLNNGGDLGLLGSSKAYQQVWARDSMVCGLGLLLCANGEGRGVHRRSLETLRRFQSPLGKLPHNVGIANVVDPALIAHGGTLGSSSDVIVDTAHAGCVDNNLWYIIGHYFNYAVTGDKDFLTSSWESLERALLWLRYQDSNECGLLEVHEAMDWADLFANRYNVLYDNVLYYAAWKYMGLLASVLGKDANFYSINAVDVQRKINTVLWVGSESAKDWARISEERKEWVYTLKRIDTELVERPFYLPYVAFRDYADRFDTLGNLLAILFGVATQQQANKILDYIQGCGLNEPFPVQSLYPVLQSGDRDWRDYYRVRNLNQPHHYHNGGSWPFIGGFYVAALVQAGRQQEAAFQLGKLARMNYNEARGGWEFNEWHHGLSGRPMGYAGQSWSTAMYIVAQDAVERGCVAILGEKEG
ncbi:MAG: glycogen debranching protein [Anaerolineae bacterium]|nr:glycogen debranching protein [Anaerolineae bacterium]